MNTRIFLLVLIISPLTAMQQEAATPPPSFGFPTLQELAKKTEGFRQVGIYLDVSENTKTILESCNRLLSQGPYLMKMACIHAIGLCLACTGIRLLYGACTEKADHAEQETAPPTTLQKLLTPRSIVGTTALIAGIGLIAKSEWLIGNHSS